MNEWFVAILTWGILGMGYFCFTLYKEFIYPLILPKIKKWEQKHKAILTLDLIDYRTWQEKFQKGGCCNDLNLGSYLRKFTKNSYTLNADYYELYYNTECYYNKFDIYFDTNFGFTLVAKSGKGLAAVGFDINETEKTITIKQIQGHAGRKDDLSKIRWEKMLVAIVVDWAKQNRFEKVQIQKAEDNEYYRTRENIFHVRYNVTAQRSGFRLDDTEKMWTLNLV